MREFICQVMADYSIIVIFLHAVSAAIWLGAMVALWFINRKASSSMPVERRFSGRAELFKKFFLFLAPFIVMVFINSFFLSLGYRDAAIDADGFIIDQDKLNIYKYINIKGAIWIAMSMNMLFMLWIINKASCRLCKTQTANECMWLINLYLLPINIGLGIIEMYLGIFLGHSS